MRHRYAILEAPSALGHVPEHLGVDNGRGLAAAIRSALSQPP